MVLSITAQCQPHPGTNLSMMKQTRRGVLAEQARSKFNRLPSIFALSERFLLVAFDETASEYDLDALATLQGVDDVAGLERLSGVPVSSQPEPADQIEDITFRQSASDAAVRRGASFLGFGRRYGPVSPSECRFR